MARSRIRALTVRVPVRTPRTQPKKPIGGTKRYIRAETPTLEKKAPAPRDEGTVAPQLGSGGFEGRQVEGGLPVAFAEMSGGISSPRRETWLLSNGSNPQLPAYVAPGPGTQPVLLIVSRRGAAAGTTVFASVAQPALASEGVTSLSPADFTAYRMDESSAPASGSAQPVRLVHAGLYRVRDLSHPTRPTVPMAWLWYPLVPGNREIWLFRKDAAGEPGWVRPESGHLGRWWIEWAADDLGPATPLPVAYDVFRVAVCADPVNEVTLSELSLEDYAITDGDV